MRSRLLTLASAGLLSLGVPAMAGVIGGSATSAGDSFQFLTIPPAAVGQDNQQQNNILYAFDEQQNVLLASALAVDSLNGGGAGSIPAGTRVSSHYVFFDPVNDTIVGNVQFDGVVIGIITSLGNLNASDFLGLPPATTVYNSPGLRGLEQGDSAVRNAILTNQVDVSLAASSPGDYVRVVTAAAVPVPAAAWTGMTLLGALGGFRLFRRRRD